VSFLVSELLKEESGIRQVESSTLILPSSRYSRNRFNNKADVACAWCSSLSKSNTLPNGRTSKPSSKRPHVIIHHISHLGSNGSRSMALSGALLLAGLALLAYFRLTRPPFPPGPNPLPIIGNILDITSKELWLTAFKWARKYGPITHIRIFNQSLVFLNTPKAVFDLLDKRGSIYSDKPHLVMASELCGCENMAAFTPYGDRARRQRKLMQKAFGPAVIPRYHGLMQMESRPFLSRLVSSPLQFQDHIRRFVSFPVNDVVSYIHQIRRRTHPPCRIWPPSKIK
jgi:hypothetical protein